MFMSQTDGEADLSLAESLQATRQVLETLGRYATHLYEASELGRLKKLSAVLVGVKVEAVEPINLAEPVFQHGIEQEDGSTAYVRLWEDSYEINGHFVATPKKHELDLIKIFIAHQGNPLLDASIYQDENFMPGADEESKKQVLSNVTTEFKNYSDNSGLFSAGEIIDTTGKTYRGRPYSAKWYGFAIDKDVLDDDSLKRSLAGDLVAQFIPEGALDGAGVKVFEHGYEIDGQVQIDAWPHSLREKEFLQILLENQGKKMTARYIVNNTNFMRNYADSTRYQKAAEYATKVVQITSGLVQTGAIPLQPGTRPHRRENWWGIDVEPAHRLKPRQTESFIKPTQEYVIRRGDGSKIYVLQKDGRYEINGRLVKNVYTTERRACILLEILLEKIGQPLTSAEIVSDERFLGEEVRGVSFFSKAVQKLNKTSGGLVMSGDLVGRKKWYGIGVDTYKLYWEKILGLNLTGIEREVVDYMSKVGGSKYNLRELADNAVGMNIPIRDITTKILPALQEKIKQNGPQFRFDLLDVKVRSEICPFLEITFG